MKIKVKGQSKHSTGRLNPMQKSYFRKHLLLSLVQPLDIKMEVNPVLLKPSFERHLSRTFYKMKTLAAKVRAKITV